MGRLPRLDVPQVKLLAMLLCLLVLRLALAAPASGAGRRPPGRRPAAVVLLQRSMADRDRGDQGRRGAAGHRRKPRLPRLAIREPSAGSKALDAAAEPWRAAPKPPPPPAAGGRRCRRPRPAPTARRSRRRRPGLGRLTARAPVLHGARVDGISATFVSGIVLAPPGVPDRVKGAINAANTIVGRPYAWGGGHGSWYASGYDCSGAVSFALAGGGFLASPLASGQFDSWGAAGRGRWITIYASPSHAYAVIAGFRWDTVGDANGSGPRWHRAGVPPAGFVARHPPGY